MGTVVNEMLTTKGTDRTNLLDCVSFVGLGEPPATQQVSHTSRPNRLRVPPGRSGPRPIARPACKFSVPCKPHMFEPVCIC